MSSSHPAARVRGYAVVAGVLYLLLACWSLRGLWPDPVDSYLLDPPTLGNGIADSDQAYMVWATARNARTLLHHPTRLRDAEQCHPLSRAAGLAHPLFADGVHAVPLQLLGLSPVLLLNVLSLVVLWGTAMTTFALAWHWTGDAVAAIVAGVAIGFHPLTVFSSRWPGILGDPWGPVVLLFAHRLFVRGAWRDAVVLAVAVGLMVLGSFYQLLPTAVGAVAYVPWLAVRHRDRLRATLPKLVLVAVVAGAAAWLQFSPALEVRAAWGTVAGRFSMLPTPAGYLPGKPRQPGTVVLVLVVVALLDRLVCRRTRDGDDPRLVHLAMALLALTVVTVGVGTPGTAWFVPSLATLLMNVPGLDAVRGLGMGSQAVHVPCALLAAYGVVAIAARLPAPWRVVVPVVLATAVAAERVVPSIALWSFGLSPVLAAEPLPPPSPALRALYARGVEGAVLDLPPCPPLGFKCRSHYLLHAAYHRHPTAVCIGSYDSPLTDAIKDLANRLPDTNAADALAALGFGTLVVHLEDESGFTLAREAALLRAVDRFPTLGAADGHVVHRLRAPAAVTEDPAVLVAPGDAVTQAAAPGATGVVFRFRNASTATYRQRDPIAPTWLRVRWERADGTLVSEERVRALLPIALAAGAEQARTIPLAVPSDAGTYRASLSPDAEPHRVLSRATVAVRAGP